MHTSYLKKSRLVLLSVTCLALGACGTAQKQAAGPITPDSKIDAALARAAASGSGPAQSLIALERTYKRNPDSTDATVAYSRALREAEYYNRAGIVLSAMAQDPDGPADAKAEYAATQLALGNYGAAERYAQQAIVKDDENYLAYHYLGIALDAQGLHKEAERSFRKALDYWEGDPTPIINNLALNLTSQEYLDEAIELLEKALAVSPNRTELERNYRIISALRETKVPRTPKPKTKPDIKPVAAVQEPPAAQEQPEEITELQVEKTEEVKEKPKEEKSEPVAEKAEEEASSETQENLTLQEKQNEDSAAQERPKTGFKTEPKFNN